MAFYPFSTVNVASDAPPASATSFTFASSLNENIATNICRAVSTPTRPNQELTVDESRTLFNAPIVYKRFGLPSFQRFRATVSIQSSQLNAQDQVGLVFILPSACATEDGGDDGNREHVGKLGQWVKVCMVIEGGKTYVKTVVCDRWEDISLVRSHKQLQAGGSYDMTVELGRKEHDDSLWVFVIDGEEKIPVRQVPWMLHIGGNVEGTRIQEPMREGWAGCYCAKPFLNAEQSALVAQVSGFELTIRSPEQMGILT